MISGVQTSENGPIQWNKELPNSCLLSAGIKRHVTPLLAGLLEVNPQKMWTFEKFFTEVTNILNKKKIHVFYVNKMTEIRVYLDKREHLDQFKSEISDQSSVDSKNQLILFQGNFLTHWVESNTPGTSYPTTNITDPIVVFDKQNNHISLGIDKVRDINNRGIPSVFW